MLSRWKSMSFSLVFLALLPGLILGQDGPRVFISVDMEGIAGVTAGSDVSSSGPDYQYFHTYDLGSECCCGGSSGGRRNRDRG